MDIRKWRPKGKSDWMILILIGVLLMVVVIPAGNHEEKVKIPYSENSGGKLLGKTDRTDREGQTEKNAGQEETKTGEYAQKLEKRLENILSKTAGAGQVEVMITLKDRGKDVIDKNIRRDGEVYEENSVLQEEGERTLPYVRGQQYPAVEGVVVLAEGAGDPDLAARLTETVMALFAVESNHVKVLPKK